MTIYIINLLLPSFFYSININLEIKLKTILIYLYIFYLAIFIGLRHHTGGDWSSNVFEYYRSQLLFQTEKINIQVDYFYAFINYLFSKLNGGVYLANFLLSAFLVYSVYIYSSLLRQRFISLLICYPYIFVVVGMGYVRQGLALSLILISLFFFKKNKFLQYLITIIFAIFSHKSALVMIFISFLKHDKYYFLKILIIIACILSSLLFINDSILRLIYYYLGDGVHLESKGAIFRNIFNSLPILLLILFYKKFLNIMNKNEIIVYSFFCVYQLCLLILSFYISTFADRMTIYSIPLQLFVYSNLFCLFNMKYKILINTMILLMYNIYFVIWIFYGKYSKVWFPYKNIVFEYF